MLIHPASALALLLLLDGPHGARGQKQKAAVPAFRSKQVDQRENAVYKNYWKIKEAARWETRWKEGYTRLGFGDKKAYQSVGCTDMENDLTFEEAEAAYKKYNFRGGLKKLNYIQDDDYDYDYEYNTGWIGDYNCYINHYNSWSWADFVYQWEDTWHLEELGFTADVWDSGDLTDPDKPYSKDWNNLTRPQKRAAYQMCYTEHIWDTWGDECD